MTGDHLSMPLGALCRATEVLRTEDSLERTAQQFRHQGLATLPVAHNGQFVGSLREARVLRALADFADPLSSIEPLVEPAETIGVGETGAEGLRRFQANGGSALVVLNGAGQPVGVLAPRDLFPRPIPRVIPPLVGGMATPFGVYLTTGAVSGGANGWGLYLSGATLAFLFILSDMATYFAAGFAPDGPAMDVVIGMLPLVFFAILMRLIPLSGTHAAEHQVVNALERGEPLEVESVRRMSRIHPRCGTNLAGAAFLFTAGFYAPFITEESLRFLLAVLLTLFFWRPFGTFLQWAITTKPASDAQIRSGIVAAEQLIANYAKSRRLDVHPLLRIYRSGMLHAMAGGTSVVTLAAWLNRVFHGPFGW